jgi:hypothetical protein
MRGVPSPPLMALLSRVVPKPMRWGGANRGPPRSCQRNSSLGSSPSSSTDQRISSVPPGVESAPYLAAFVHSSWMTSAKPCVAFGVSRIGGPSIEARATKLANSRAITSFRVAPYQSVCVNNAFAFASACSRAVKVSRASPSDWVPERLVAARDGLAAKENCVFDIGAEDFYLRDVAVGLHRLSQQDGTGMGLSAPSNSTRRLL